MNWQQLTIIEILFCVLIVIGLCYEEKLISFEQRIVEKFRLFCSIIKDVERQNISMKKFFYILYAAAAEEMRESLK